MDTYTRIKDIVSAANCEFLGVADLAPARDFIRDQGGDAVGGYPKAISIGIALPRAIVDQLPNRADPAVAASYRSHAYDIINQRLNDVASRVASALQRDGYAAYPIPASDGYDRDRNCAAFSHKLAAHLAGLGWIGKSCLLVTPQVGPRVRWISVLTDAPLPGTGAAESAGQGLCRSPGATPLAGQGPRGASYYLSPTSTGCDQAVLPRSSITSIRQYRAFGSGNSADVTVLLPTATLREPIPGMDTIAIDLAGDVFTETVPSATRRSRISGPVDA